MAENDSPTANVPEEPAPPEPTLSEEEADMGDFITRHVLEKDSVFFEG